MEYIVKALTVGGKNNKVYRAGETVTAACFSSSADTLVAQGFLARKNKGVETPADKPVEKPFESISDAVAAAADVDEDLEVPAEVSYDDITKGGVMEELEKCGLVRNEDFKKGDSKKDLWDLWMAELKK